MALDTKRKRGSAIGLTQPFRVWLAEPDGTLAVSDRASLLKLCSAIDPASPSGSVPNQVFLSGVFGSKVVRARRY